MQIEYRIACPEDLKEICDLVRHATEKMIAQDILQWDELYPDEEILCRDIDRKQLNVGIIDKKIAVMYVLNIECDDEYKNGQWRHGDKPYGIIHRLCVNPVFQNKGIARTTMLHIESEALARGFQAIRLDVFTGNPIALKLYTDLGYCRAGYADWRKGRFYLMEKYLL